jgi:hypothetical protein
MDPDARLPHLPARRRVADGRLPARQLAGGRALDGADELHRHERLVLARRQAGPPDFVRFDLDPPEGGFALAIRVAHRIREELEAPQATVVATGGLAELIAPHSAVIEHVDPFLTLEGLRLVWELNRDS